MSEVERPKAATPAALSGLKPFLRPYRGRILLAAVFLVGAALTTLLFPAVLGRLIDAGLLPRDRTAQLFTLREHFRCMPAELFQIAVGTKQEDAAVPGMIAAREHGFRPFQLRLFDEARDLMHTLGDLPTDLNPAIACFGLVGRNAKCGEPAL